MGTPKPSAAPSITALRSMAAMARRTRTSSSGLRLLLMARMVLARAAADQHLELLVALELLQAARRRHAREHVDVARQQRRHLGGGSLMKRIVTRRSFTSLALRKPSQRASVTAEPLFQLSSL
jgi:hypothetical protein